MPRLCGTLSGDKRDSDPRHEGGGRCGKAASPRRRGRRQARPPIPLLLSAWRDVFRTRWRANRSSLSIHLEKARRVKPAISHSRWGDGRACDACFCRFLHMRAATRKKTVKTSKKRRRFPCFEGEGERRFGRPAPAADRLAGSRLKRAWSWELLVEGTSAAVCAASWEPLFFPDKTIFSPQGINWETRFLRGRKGGRRAALGAREAGGVLRRDLERPSNLGRGPGRGCVSPPGRFGFCAQGAFMLNCEVADAAGAAALRLRVGASSASARPQFRSGK